MSARWYKRCGADFIHGTMMLTLEEKGAYSLCLDLIYDRGGPIPDDARWLAGVCGVSIRKWGKLRQGLLDCRLIHIADGMLMSGDFDASNLVETRPAISPSVRQAVKERASGVCSYCGNSDGPFEIDHIYPISRGGTNELENLTLACRPCNRSKSAKTIHEWTWNG